MFEELEVSKNYPCLLAPEIFLAQTTASDHCDQQFNLFIMINLKSRKFIQMPITRRLFDDLPMKEAALKMNNFSTKIEDGIFYCCFLKPLVQPAVHRYCETFFWLSQPVKHTNRTLVLHSIKKFISDYLEKCRKHERLKHETFLNDKLWVVDWRGAISYLNRESIFDGEVLKANLKRMNHRSSMDNNLQAICLQMFLGTLHKGTFNHTLAAESPLKKGIISPF